MCDWNNVKTLFKYVFILSKIGIKIVLKYQITLAITLTCTKTETGGHSSHTPRRKSTSDIGIKNRFPKLSVDCTLLPLIKLFNQVNTIKSYPVLRGLESTSMLPLFLLNSWIRHYKCAKYLPTLFSRLLIKIHKPIHFHHVLGLYYIN